VANDINRSTDPDVRRAKPTQGQRGECARRLRQIVSGQLQVPDETLIAVASHLTDKVIEAEVMAERRKMAEAHRVAKEKSRIDKAAARRRR
jgi:bacterioferritin-associated ferredoxin